LEWAIYRIDVDDIPYYSPTIHTLFANLEQLLTDSMTPMLDVKLSSPKCLTICRLGQYVAILSYIVALFMAIVH